MYIDQSVCGHFVRIENIFSRKRILSLALVDDCGVYIVR